MILKCKLNTKPIRNNDDDDEDNCPHNRTRPIDAPADDGTVMHVCLDCGEYIEK